jgi:hypothetical protein
MTKEELDELYAFNIPLCVKAKCANKDMSIELTDTLYALHPKNTLAQHKRAAAKLLNKMMKANREIGLHPEDKHQQQVTANQKERAKQANDPVYKTKRLLCKSVSALKQRVLNSASNIKKNETAVLKRALLKIIRFSTKAIPCIIETKDVCLREEPKRAHNHNKICPMQDKFCLEDGKCHPIKKKE